MKLLSVVAVLIAVILTGVAVWQIGESADSIDNVEPYASVASPSGEPIVVTVQEGQGPQEIGERLQKTGVIDSATQFRVLVSFLGYDGILQAGEYEFAPGTRALDAVYRMRRGIVSTRSVTVVEGWRLEQIADTIVAKGIPRDDFLAAARNRDYAFDFLAGLRSGQSLEGYLYPATYPIRKSDTARDVVQRMLQGFADNAAAEVQGQAAGGLRLHEVVTLASIIEREAKVPSERPIMAQVFLSRLAQGIPLQADPTVQYAVSADPNSVEAYGYWKKELTSADKQVGSPYNTYQVAGPPPGPICSPGLESIRAVLNPAKTNYLYFVAKPDGSHLFAETFEEHLKNSRTVLGQ